MGLFDNLFGSKESKTREAQSAKLEKLIGYPLAEVPGGDKLKTICDDPGFYSGELDCIADNLILLRSLSAETHIYEGCISACLGENEEYASIMQWPQKFALFMAGYKSFGIDLWNKNRENNCMGLTKEQLITFRGNPTSVESTLSGETLIETLVYGNSKSHGTYFVLDGGKVTKQTIR